ncbi:MAG TPA: hypothetical protein VKA15_13560, partial [Isosphaeraceae bacterium]|nr:hypothetical protein [Isosphaeraceae bacterium]
MRHRHAVITLVWLAVPVAFARAQNPADAIYHGGSIITIDEKNPTAEAVAVRDGKIIAVGKKEDVLIKYKIP